MDVPVLPNPIHREGTQIMAETINILSIFVGGPQNAKRVFRKASVGTIGVDARIVYFENRDGQWVEIAAKDIPPYQPMSEETKTMP